MVASPVLEKKIAQRRGRKKGRERKDRQLNLGKGEGKDGNDCSRSKHQQADKHPMKVDCFVTNSKRAKRRALYDRMTRNRKLLKTLGQVFMLTAWKTGRNRTVEDKKGNRRCCGGHPKQNQTSNRGGERQKKKLPKESLHV